MKTSTICAVIVTHNRKVLLRRTLNAIYSQTYSVHQVIIVDNASSDGTSQWLAESGYLQKANLRYEQLAENVGGAGGFEKGITLAYETQCDWLWLMDDDGYPAPDCLVQLLHYRDQFDFYGPLVLDDQTGEKLSFPIHAPIQKQYFQTNKQIKAYIEETHNNILTDVLIPFNGVLLRRNLVEQIGTPYTKFFIWGDDIEYTYRARQHGARIATLAEIYFYHPTAPQLGTRMFFGKMQFNDTSSKIKLYCLCRNNTNNLKTYRGKLYALAFIAKAYWFYLFTMPSWQKLKFVHKALWAGWSGDFRQHRAYIGASF